MEETAAPILTVNCLKVFHVEQWRIGGAALGQLARVGKDMQ